MDSFIHCLSQELYYISRADGTIFCLVQDWKVKIRYVWILSILCSLRNQSIFLSLGLTNTALSHLPYRASKMVKEIWLI